MGIDPNGWSSGLERCGEREVIDWSKTICGDFDRIDLVSHKYNYFQIEMRVGHDVERVRMQLRSEEAIRDLHYALGRYLTCLGEEKRKGA